MQGKSLPPYKKPERTNNNDDNKTDEEEVPDHVKKLIEQRTSPKQDESN
jgi:hypothetical protein